MPVLTTTPHRHDYRGDQSMKDKKKFDATYKMGNTTIHINAPINVSDAEKEQVLDELHLAAWAIVDEIIERGEEV